VAVAGESELDAVMDQAFAVRAVTGADFIEQGHGAFFQQAGANPAEHVVRGLAFQDDVVDSASVKQLSQQQSRRPCANDCYFCPQYLPP
jgi:hypothetical protein